MEEKKLFAISDLHLSFYREKSMGIFGDIWIDHHKKIEQNWKNIISNEDTVLIPGDISWAMATKEAIPDLEFIASLPGKKILLKGNHDYWWNSVSKLNSMFENMSFLQNDFYKWENFAICGSRGWIFPSDTRFCEDDVKTYNRELKRYELSLSLAKANGFDDIIFMSHYPPIYADNTNTEFSAILKEYNVKKVIYGHLHGINNFDFAAEGFIDEIEYSLVSCDYLNFIPKRIL